MRLYLFFILIILDSVMYAPHDVGILWLDTDTGRIWWERPAKMYSKPFDWE